MKKFLIITVAVLSAIISCKSQYEVLLASSDVDAKYKAAMDFFAAKKYQKSAQLFESMAVLTSGTSRDDTVQITGTGGAVLLDGTGSEDYYTAESNFSKFIENFPQSPFTPDAQFYRLDCLYRATYRWELDQNPTRACMSAINEYIREHQADDIHRPA